MAWLEPKVNYTPNDYFNANDYNNIAGNINYLHVKSLKLVNNYGSMANMPTKDAENYTSLLYASDFNNVINNINKINTNAYNKTLVNMPAYTPGGRTPTAAEVNIINSNIKKMSIDIEANADALDRLNIKLGNFKGVKL